MLWQCSVHAPKAHPKKRPLTCPLARSGHLSKPMRWGRRLLLPQKSVHNPVGNGHNHSRSVSSQRALRSLPVSTNGVPPHGAQLPSVLALRPRKCRPEKPSAILWAAVWLPEKTEQASGSRLALPLPLEEWCGPLIVFPGRLPVELGHDRKVCVVTLLRKPEGIASLGTKWNALIPSSEQTVLTGLRSVRAWMARPAHSVPAY